MTDTRVLTPARPALNMRDVQAYQSLVRLWGANMNDEDLAEFGDAVVKTELPDYYWHELFSRWSSYTSAAIAILRHTNLHQRYTLEWKDMLRMAASKPIFPVVLAMIKAPDTLGSLDDVSEQDWQFWMWQLVTKQPNLLGKVAPYLPDDFKWGRLASSTMNEASHPLPMVLKHVPKDYPLSWQTLAEEAGPKTLEQVFAFAPANKEWDWQAMIEGWVRSVERLEVIFKHMPATVKLDYQALLWAALDEPKVFAWLLAKAPAGSIEA